jgi:hypothetical protein
MTAADYARAQVDPVRDDPAGRVALLAASTADLAAPAQRTCLSAARRWPS